ncbi:hypothetical protein [Clostridium akagii]|uniref:hypothetical protein n=1 Tax=Clostridium akagii TaxID=91623 RepID=UPI00047E3C0F|nr:hypothetical protein [Clostridium akagii]
MKKIILKVIFTVAVTTLIFTGCSESSNTKTNIAAEKKAASIYTRQNPEATVKEYYSSEVSKDSTFLSGFFLNSKMSQSVAVKKQLSSFKVKKLELINVYNEKRHGDYITMVCTYNTFFNGIAYPRPDVEVVTLVKKSGEWYFLNDYSKIADSDMIWINQMATEQKNVIAQNKTIIALLKQSSTFDMANSTYLANAMKNQSIN